MGLADKLAVQSYCFRHFKANEEVAAKVKETGLAGIELCGVHADFTKEADFDRIIRAYRDAKVEIVSIGVQGFRNQEAVEEKYFEFCRRAGAKYMAVDFDPATAPACYRVAEKLADKYDIRLGIHNHGGRHWLGNTQMLNFVFNQTSPRIGLEIDTAWALDAGEDPVAMSERFGNRLYGVHVKDFTFDKARRPKDVVAGKGNLDLKKLAATLAKVNFSGIMVLEYEGDVENPVPALVKCVQSVRKAFA